LGGGEPKLKRESKVPQGKEGVSKSYQERKESYISKRRRRQRGMEK